ncbi:MAG: HNH endonuclease [Flavobacteriales bacterium]|nr:HNH endonuclease [Flavobacteriales bacterium]
MINKKIEFLPNERLKKVSLEGKNSYNYAISDYGRMIRYQNDMSKDGEFLKGGLTSGYPSFHYKHNNKSYCIYFHKLVAQCFLGKNSNEQDMVLHLDYDKTNNHYSNLKWCTKQESLEHQRKNAKYVVGNSNPKKGAKLDAKKVISIKKKLLKLEKTTNKVQRKMLIQNLTKYYKISKVQLYRIKNGQSWKHIQVED